MLYILTTTKLYTFSVRNYTKTYNHILKHKCQKHIIFVVLNFWSSYMVTIPTHLEYIHTKTHCIAIIYSINTFAKIIFCSKSYYQKKKIKSMIRMRILRSNNNEKTLRTYFSSFKCTAQNQFAMTLRISLPHHMTTKEMGNENKLK